MGMSATAHLFFGLDLGEDSPLYPRTANGELDYDAVEGDEDFDGADLGAYLSKRAGLRKPEPSARGRDLGNATGQDAYALYEEWLAETEDGQAYDQARIAYRAAAKKLRDEAPVELVQYGSWNDADESYGIAVKGTIRDGIWEGAHAIVFEAPTAGEVGHAIRFCEEHGIPAPKGQDWTWRLTASYG